MTLSSLREWANELKRHTLVVYFLARDPRTRWLVRILALLIAAYALSPIDLIPDFIPVLGYLDDLVIIPVGLWLVLRLASPEVVHASREEALTATERPVSRAMVAVVVVIWIATIGVFGLWVWRTVGST